MESAIRSKSRSWWPTIIVGLALLILGSMVLLKTWSYHGKLLRGWDAQFYYAQAQSIAFDGSLDITASLDSAPHRAPFLPNDEGFLTALPRHQGRVINKYPIGLSLLEVPLMRCGELANSFSASPPTKDTAGYSQRAMLAVGLGLLFISVMGLALLHRLIQNSYGFWPAFTGIMTAWMGTSLFHYTAIFPYMAHGVAFTIVVAILWQIEILRSSDVPRTRNFVLLAFLFGYLFLVRPQQILLLPLVLPFLIGPLRRNPRPIIPVLLSGLMLGLLAGFQAGLNYAQVGSLTLNAYASNNEGFSWTHPDWRMVLIHPARGVFWMTPVFIIATLAVVFKRPISAGEKMILLHTFVQTYLIACWSSPEQGDSFGPRMLTECTPLIAMGIAKLLSGNKFSTRILSLAVISACVIWTNYLLLLYMRGDLLLATSYQEIFEGMSIRRS